MPDHDQPEQAALAASLLRLAEMWPAEIQSDGAAATAAVRAAVEALYMVEQGEPGPLARYVARSFSWATSAAQDRVLDLLLYHMESTRPCEALDWKRSRHLYWPARRLGPKRFRLAAQVAYLVRAGHPNEGPPPALVEGSEGLPHRPGPEELCCEIEHMQEQREEALASLAAISPMLTPRQEEAARRLLGGQAGQQISEVAEAMHCDDSVARKHINACCARFAERNSQGGKMMARKAKNAMWALVAAGLVLLPTAAWASITVMM